MRRRKHGYPKEFSTMRKSICHTLIAAAIAAGIPAFAQAEDLMQIYQQARQSDPTLAISEANKGATEENVPQARAALLPQIGASIGYNHSDGNTNSVGPVQDVTTGNFVLLPSSSMSRD